MNILIITYILTILITSESALMVYRLNRISKLNRIYAAYAGTFTIYSIIMIQFLLSPDEISCIFWHRMLVFTACFFVAFGIRYFMELTMHDLLIKRQVYIKAIYIIPLIFALPSITFWPVTDGFIRSPWGWGLIINKSPWTVCFNSYMILSSIICTILVIRWYFTAKTDRDKKNALLLVASSMVGNLGLLHLFFPAAHSEISLLLYTHFNYIFCFAIFVFSIRFAIVKYGLMTIIPGSPASDLIDGMSEALFLINTQGKIIFLNKNARLLARKCKVKDNTCDITSFFASKEIFKHEIDELIHGRKINQPVILVASGNTKDIALETSLLEVKNKVGTPIGFVVLIRESGGIHEFQEQYHLSPRELEVLLLLCNGSSAHEISVECEVTLQTAKSHIHNIYQKTGLKNRVELSNLINTRF